jgi:hypothetical protein
MNHGIDFGYVDDHVRVRALPNQLLFIFPVQISHIGFRLEDGWLIVRPYLETDSRQVGMFQKMSAAQRRDQIHELPLDVGTGTVQLTMSCTAAEQIN